MNNKTMQITTLAILSAAALLTTFLTRQISFIPGYAFLTLDMKDVVIVIAGFIWDPMSAFHMSLVVSIIEMLTLSNTGFIGLLMNVLSSCAFACTASIVYAKWQTMRGAIAGLVLGIFLSTAFMMLWDFIVTPLYQGVPRQVIAAALLPVFLPFNLIKNGLNTATTILLYKPLVRVLRSAHLLPVRPAAAPQDKENASLMLVAAVILVTMILSIVIYAKG